MLAIGAGGLDVAMAMVGQPFYVKMPKIWGVKLIGSLPPWVSAILPLTLVDAAEYGQLSDARYVAYRRPR